MASPSKAKKQRIQGKGSKALLSHLPERVRRRLDILTEDQDIADVLSDAIMLLWRQRYPAPTDTAAEYPDTDLPETQPAAVAPSPLTSDQTAATATERQQPAEAVVLEPEPLPQQSFEAAEEKTVDFGSDASPEAVREQAQDMRASGMSLTAIAAKLNALHAPTLSGSGRWHHTAVKRLLGK